MSVDYSAVLTDLREKRDALDNLIAALEDVARLNGPVSAAAFAEAVRPKADKASPRLASPRLARAVPPRAKAKPDRRATVGGRASKWDAPVLSTLRVNPQGLGLKEISETVGGKTGSIFGTLKRLVRDRQVVKQGTQYRLAGTTAKEAV